MTTKTRPFCAKLCYMRPPGPVLNSFMQICSPITLAVHQASIEQDLGGMSHLNVSVVAAHSDLMFLHSILALAHLHWPVLTLPRPNCSTALTSCREALANPQFKPPSLQVKAVFRKGFSKTFAKLSRKIDL